MADSDPVLVRRRAGVLARRTLDGAVLLAPDADARPVRLNAGAAIIWDLLRAPMTASDLAAEVADAFDLDLDRAGDDVDTGIRALLDARLVVDDPRA